MPATRRTVCLRGACAALLALGQAQAASAEEPSDKPKNDEAPLRQLVVDPAPEPSPALRYRLLPAAWELKRGNAAVMYLRRVHAYGDAWKELLDESNVWLSFPIEQVPPADIREYLERPSFDHLYKQLEIAARRDHAEWEYPIRDVPAFEIRLPATVAMRRYVRFVALKARLEIVEGRFDEAMRTLQTGLAMARHEAEAQFLVTSLVAIRLSVLMFDRVEELIAQPGAPNLYWALTKLPSPFVDFHNDFDFESRMLELSFPELADLERQRTPEQWRTLVEKIEKSLPGLGAGKEAARVSPTALSDLMEKGYPNAKRHLIERQGRPASQVEAMARQQVVLIHLMDNYAQWRDEFFKWYEFPYWQSRPALDKAKRRLDQVARDETNPFASIALSPFGNVYPLQAGSERSIAALRVIEALRMYAAAHDGALPERLNQITIVPVPKDPMTGRAFEYRRDGEAALLTARAPKGLSAEDFGLRYRISIRPKGADADSK